MAQNKPNTGGVIGAAVVGAVVGAASVALMDKKTRDKVTKKVSGVISEGESQVNKMFGTADEVKGDVKKKVLPKIERAKREVKKS